MASDDTIKFRCTKAFKKLVKSAAKQRRRSMANFIIDALFDHMAPEEKRLHLPVGAKERPRRPKVNAGPKPARLVLVEEDATERDRSQKKPRLGHRDQS